MPTLLRFVVRSLPIVTAFAGCDVGGQTGSPSMDPCEERVVDLADLDEVAPNGVRGQDLLDLVLGDWPLRFEWDDGETTEGQARVNYDGGAARFVDSEPRGGGVDPMCGDKVEVDARIELESAEAGLEVAWPVAPIGEQGDGGASFHGSLSEPGADGDGKAVPAPWLVMELVWYGEQVAGQLTRDQPTTGSACIATPDDCAAVPSEPVDPGDAPLVGGITTVARTVEELDAAWTEILGDGALPPDVDFASQMVVLHVTDAICGGAVLSFDLRDCDGALEAVLRYEAPEDCNPTGIELTGGIAVTALDDREVAFVERARGEC